MNCSEVFLDWSCFMTTTSLFSLGPVRTSCHFGQNIIFFYKLCLKNYLKQVRYFLLMAIPQNPTPKQLNTCLAHDQTRTSCIWHNFKIRQIWNFFLKECITCILPVGSWYWPPNDTRQAAELRELKTSLLICHKEARCVHQMLCYE